MYEMFAVNNKVFNGGDRTLKEVEMWEDNGDHWIVRHRYAVGFAFFKDWTDMVLEFNAIPETEYDEVSWHLYRSMDGKILNDQWYITVYMKGNKAVRKCITGPVPNTPADARWWPSRSGIFLSAC
jgi:hypothetical protein